MELEARKTAPPFAALLLLTLPSLFTFQTLRELPELALGDIINLPYNKLIT